MSLSFSRYASSRIAYAVVLSLVLQPYAAIASPPTEHATRAADIALLQGGVLQGQVLSETGQGQADVVVKLASGRNVWQAKTDSQGWFQLTELRGGTYQFQVDDQRQLIRAWSDGTAPPKASQGILVTPSTDIVRGQQTVPPKVNGFFRMFKNAMSDPLIASGIVLTAVAIPVAIHNADDDDPPATP